MRASAAARPIADRHFRDAGWIDAEDRRQEPVHAARQLRADDELAAIGLETAAAVIHRHAGRPRDQPVGDTRREDTGHERLAPLQAPPAYDVDPLVEAREQARDVGGVVLAVAVERDHDGATRMREPGRKRRGLPEVAVEIDDADMRVRRGQQLEARERAVAAAVVDEEDFVRPAEVARDPGELGMERRDVLLFIVDRDDQRERRGRSAAAHLRKKSRTPSATRSTSSSVRSAWTGSDRISRAARSARGSAGPSP